MDRAGYAASGIGDINGDGLDDVLIGAPDAGPFSGASYVVFGNDDGLPESIELSDLASGDGTLGFALIGAQAYDTIGRSVSGVGDFNGDGLDDFMVGAGYAGAYGEVYLIFGAPEFPPSIEVAALGAAGVLLRGEEVGDAVGTAVAAAGDVNGDGFDDLLITARNAGEDGEAYVVFGTDQPLGATLNVGTLSPAQGFPIVGFKPRSNALLAASSAGDLNGDGYDEVMVSAFDATIEVCGNAQGLTYVVLGRADGVSEPVDISSFTDGDGSEGFVVLGAACGNRSGYAIGGGGDFNGDGVDDIIIGAPDAKPGGRNEAGAAFVLFGRSEGFPPRTELSELVSGDGSLGFALNGINEDDGVGTAVGMAGDLNHDGIEDLIVGAHMASPNDLRLSGQSYVIFGRDDGFPAEIELSSIVEGDGSAGFAIDGAAASDFAGRQVGEAGDVNGDGIDDLLVGAFGADAGGRTNAGRTYVLFGTTEPFAPVFNLFQIGEVGSFLSTTVAGVRTFFAACLNRTDPQEAIVTPADQPGFFRFNCGEIGVAANVGDNVQVIVDGRSAGDRFVGESGGFEGNARLLCRNLTQGVDTLPRPLGETGAWSCSDAGLPIALGDQLRAIVSGTTN
ncbi:MAG: integrin alpha [Pseudomonadota bacterium]